MKPHQINIPVFCAERARRLIGYSEAIAELKRLSNALSDGSLSYEPEAFLRAWGDLKEGLMNCERRHQALMLHIRSHRCGVVAQPVGPHLAAG